MAQFVKITRAARGRHKLTRTRILAAMHHSGVPVIEDDGSLRFTGRDSQGVLLEVIASTGREGGDSLIVRHAMPVLFRTPKHLR